MRQELITRNFLLDFSKGLLPPPGHPRLFPFLWVAEDTGRPPPMLWFMWYPIGGYLRVSAQGDHRSLGAGARFPFGEWLRGLYWPGRRIAALLTYNPYPDEETWTKADEKRNQLIKSQLRHCAAPPAP